MNDLSKGMIAGMSAALLTGGLDHLLQSTAGLGNTDVFSLTMIVSRPLLGTSTSAPAWLTCAAVGALVYGSAFAALFPRLPGQAAVWRGIVFASVMWLALMLVIIDRKSTRLNASHYCASRMPSYASNKKQTHRQN